MALHFLYRIIGGEVLGASTDQSFPDRDQSRFGVLTDPLIPDGKDLAVKKIALPGSNTVRNATAGEITTMNAALTTEVTETQRLGAKNLLDTVIPQGKYNRALLEIFLSEFNIIRTHAALGLAPRTANQLKNAIRNKIDSGDVD